MTDAANSGKTAAARGRPFEKGKSGNPKGRPKVDVEFRAKCRQAVDEHVFQKWLDEVVNSGENWMEAAKMLTAYGYGKPTERHEVDANEGLLAALGIGGASPLEAAEQVAGMSPDEQTEVARGG